MRSRPLPLHLCPPPRPAAALESDRRYFFRCVLLTIALLSSLSLLSGCIRALGRPPVEPANPRYCADTTRVMVASQPLAR